MIQKVSTGYTPRQHQAIVHRELRRFNVLLCHRRWGKTHFALNEAIDQGLRCSKKNPVIVYIAPTYSQAKRICWDLLKSYLQDIPGATFNEADLRAEIARPSARDKVKIILLGAENPAAIRGMYIDLAILDEYSEMHPEVWTSVVRPALSDRQGGAIFLFTPKGKNHSYDLYMMAKDKPDWLVKSFKASETGIVPKSELEAAQAMMSDAEYQQEFEVSFSASLVGAYYGKEMDKAEADGRICAVPYEASMPVSTYWDLGVSDTTVIWFGQILKGREIRWIDYVEESGQGLDYYAKVLKEKGYVYDEHVLPHDASQRELGTGKSRIEVLQNLLKGARIRVAPRDNIADGISASRLLLKKSWFDKHKCAKGIISLQSYERVWDAKNKVFQDRPKHNFASHAADAFRTAAMSLDENKANREEWNRKLPRSSDSTFKVV